MSQSLPTPPDPRALFGPRWYGEQDENGVDLSLIREMLALPPIERLRRGDRHARDTLKLLDYGRRHRENQARAGRRDPA